MYSYGTLVIMSKRMVRIRSKESVCEAGDTGLNPGSGRYSGEGNGNLSSILAWEIPWTVEPGRLQSTGSQRVGRDLVIKQQQQHQLYVIIT